MIVKIPFVDVVIRIFHGSVIICDDTITICDGKNTVFPQLTPHLHEPGAWHGIQFSGEGDTRGESGGDARWKPHIPRILYCYFPMDYDDGLSQFFFPYCYAMIFIIYDIVCYRLIGVYYSVLMCIILYCLILYNMI